tara:strand:- start:779 stop:1192 length:414 start_codon:yes stop_codon:yes gene_type:complete
VKRNDPTYIAGIEKAVAEKYGKETVQDFRSQWEEEKEKEYLNQLDERNQKSHLQKQFKPTVERGGILIKKRGKTSKRTRSCPICKTYSFSSGDDLYMNRFKCCKICYLDFVQGNEKNWSMGRRPSVQHIKESLGRRK